MIISSEFVDACDHVVAAAVNGVYQGIILALLVSLGLRLFARTNAATRHAIWFATLVLLACLIPAHCLLDHRVPAAAAPAGTDRTQPASVGASAVRADLASLPGSSEEPILTRKPLRLERFNVEPSPVFLESDVLEEDELPSGSEQATAHVDPSNAAGSTEASGSREYRPELGAAPAPVESGFHSRARQFLLPLAWTYSPGWRIHPLASVVLLMAWLGASALRVSFLLWRLSQLRKLNANAVPAGHALQELLQRVRRNLGVRRKLELKLSPMQRSPVLLGFFNPVILLPADQPANGAEAEAILRHELAHVRRRDDWANLVQHLIQALLFFHPAVWWIARQLSIEREIACDDHVLQQGGRARDYALLLADLASRVKTSRPLLAPGVSNSKSQLQKRIDMLLNTRRNTSPRLAKTRLGFITSAAAMVAALALYAAPRFVLAQSSATVPNAGEPRVNASPAAPAGAAAVASPPGALDMPVLALNESPDVLPTPGPPDVEPGPKIKPENSVNRATEPTSVAPSAGVALPAVTPVQASVNAPRVEIVPRAVSSPHVPKAPGDASFEQRLKRLEKLVDSLLEQKEPQHHAYNGYNAYSGKEAAQQNIAKNKDILKQAQERADLEAARAADQAKRRVKDAEKEANAKLQENATKQLEALRQQREHLERQMQMLQQNIERLEQQQEKLQEEQQRRSELLEERARDAEVTALLEESTAEESSDGATALAQ